MALNIQHVMNLMTQKPFFEDEDNHALPENQHDKLKEFDAKKTVPEQALNLELANLTPPDQDVTPLSADTASPYGSDTKSQQEQYNHGNSGAGDGMVAGTATVDQHVAQDNKEEQKNARRREVFATVDAIRTMQDLMNALNDEQDALNESKLEFGLLKVQAERTLSEIDEAMSELEQQIKQQEEELRTLKESGAPAEEIEAKEQQLNAYKGVHETFSDRRDDIQREMREGQEKLDLAQEKLDSLSAKIKAEGGMENAPDYLKEELAQAMSDHKAAIADMNQLQTYDRATKSILEMAEDTIASGKGPITPEQAQLQTKIMNKILDAVENDGAIDFQEGQEIKELSEQLKEIAPEQAQDFANKMAAAGVVFIGQDGTRYEGQEAADFVLNKYEEIQKERTDALNKIDEEQAKIAENEQVKADSAQKLSELTSTGTLAEQDAEKAGAVINGGNFTRATENYLDMDGNAVNVEYSADGDRQFFYLDEAGEKNYYDQTHPEYSTFEAIAGGEAIFVNSEAPLSSPAMSYAPGHVPPENPLADLIGATSSPAQDGRIYTLQGMTNGVETQSYQISTQGSIAQMDIEQSQKIVAEQETIVATKDSELAELKPTLDQSVQEGLIDQARIDQIDEDAQKGRSALADSSTRDDNWSADDQLNMDSPDHSFQQAETSHNNALAAVEGAALSGSELSQEDFDRLKEMPGMSEEKLTTMMEEKGVELEGAKIAPAGTDILAKNNLVFTPLNTVGAQMSSPAIMQSTPQANEYGISAISPNEVPSVLDEFDQYNDKNATYMEPANNNTQNVPSLTEASTPALTGDSKSGSGSQEQKPVDVMELLANAGKADPSTWGGQMSKGSTPDGSAPGGGING